MQNNSAKTKKTAKVGAITGLAITAGLLGATASFAQEQCATYKVSRGDTLSQIASRAKVPGGYQTVFLANSNILSNPNRLEVGQVLQIPCENGSLPWATIKVA